MRPFSAFRFPRIIFRCHQAPAATPAWVSADISFASSLIRARRETPARIDRRQNRDSATSQHLRGAKSLTSNAGEGEPHYHQQYPGAISSVRFSVRSAASRTESRGPSVTRCTGTCRRYGRTEDGVHARETVYSRFAAATRRPSRFHHEHAIESSSGGVSSSDEHEPRGPACRTSRGMIEMQMPRKTSRCPG